MVISIDFYHRNDSVNEERSTRYTASSSLLLALISPDFILACYGLFLREKEKKMNYQWNEETMNDKEGFEALRRGGFTEEEIRRLSQLRSNQSELEVGRTSTEYHRLEFVRWLVATVKLSDHLT